MQDFQYEASTASQAFLGQSSWSSHSYLHTTARAFPLFAVESCLDMDRGTATLRSISANLATHSH